MRYDPSYTYDRQDIDKLYQELFGRDSKDAGAEYWLNYANNTIDEGSVDPQRLRNAIIAGAQPGGSDYTYYQQNVLNPGPPEPPPYTNNPEPPIIVDPESEFEQPPSPPITIPPPMPPPNTEPFNPADDTVPFGKGGAPTSGPGTVGYGKGGQDTAADLFRTGGARPMGPSTFSPYASGDYYRNTMNRQADVFGRPSYMYSPQQSPYMPMQPYSMGSPYQQPMGKGGQGYNQRSPYSNPYGGSQGYDMMPPQTPYYQRPSYNPMPQKGGPSGPPPPYSPYNSGTQAYVDKDGNMQYGTPPRANDVEPSYKPDPRPIMNPTAPSYQPTPQKGGGTMGYGTPYGASYQPFTYQSGKGGQQPMMGQTQTGGNTPQPPLEPD